MSRTQPCWREPWQPLFAERSRCPIASAPFEGCGTDLAVCRHLLIDRLPDPVESAFLSHILTKKSRAAGPAAVV